MSSIGGGDEAAAGPDQHRDARDPAVQAGPAQHLPSGRLPAQPRSRPGDGRRGLHAALHPGARGPERPGRVRRSPSAAPRDRGMPARRGAGRGLPARYQRRLGRRHPDDPPRLARRRRHGHRRRHARRRQHRQARHAGLYRRARGAGELPSPRRGRCQRADRLRRRAGLSRRRHGRRPGRRGRDPAPSGRRGRAAMPPSRSGSRPGSWTRSGAAGASSASIRPTTRPAPATRPSAGVRRSDGPGGVLPPGPAKVSSGREGRPPAWSRRSP